MNCKNCGHGGQIINGKWLHGGFDSLDGQYVYSEECTGTEEEACYCTDPESD